MLRARCLTIGVRGDALCSSLTHGGCACEVVVSNGGFGGDASVRVIMRSRQCWTIAPLLGCLLVWSVDPSVVAPGGASF